MSSLLSFYVKKETLETLLKTVNAKGEKGLELTLSISEEPNQYGQNVSGWVSQTKEQREAKKDRYFVGNGKVIWTDGTIKVVQKEEPKPAPAPAAQEKDDLPF
jgi:hypothetical protein